MNQPTITTLPPSPEDDRHSRMKKYFIAMIIRVLCLLCLLFLHGWWLVLPVIGSIVLPYFAMLIANVTGTPPGGNVESPGGLLPYRPQPGAQPGDASEGTDADTAADTTGGTGPAADEPAAPESGEPDPTTWIVHEATPAPAPAQPRVFVMPASTPEAQTPEVPHA
ncbi:DUF3099 domain-containing protein [Mycetocola spongiae]|uniref:DUF3099 domain-containing protein n=1 Tax=Mycetocola spongiae TaxID=2859226 RepID=UPI001CF2C513|nr:DUF3099 domain-containing protein [Mycetocola spongiae]UCR89687.1 DUF3099 domain-containing protein [Mycetocola spongiae]